MTVRVNPVVLRLRDDDGYWTGAGDTVHFAYGIPPVGVDAPIIERDGQLIGLCPGHNPPEFKLRSLRRYVGNWYKQNTWPCGGADAPSVEANGSQLESGGAK